MPNIDYMEVLSSVVWSYPRAGKHNERLDEEKNHISLEDGVIVTFFKWLQI